MDEANGSAGNDLVDFTARIVAAYVGNNPVQIADLPRLIGEVHACLGGLSAEPVELTEEKPVPAVSPRKSVTPDYLICLEDGKKFKSLRRHLAVHYDLTPEQYRKKWNLPADYPMVAPNYSSSRSAMALSIGLGKKRAPEPEQVKPARKTLSLKFS